MVLSEAQEQYLETLRSVYLSNDKYTAIVLEPTLAQVYAVLEKADIFFDANNDLCLHTLKAPWMDVVRERTLSVLATRGAVNVDVVLSSDDVDGALATLDD